jgi:hypothetical protein
MGYSDEGVLDVSVGEANAEGLAVDIVLETDSGAWHTCPPAEIDLHSDVPLFVVTAVHATILGLSLTFSKSRHRILNKLLVCPIFSGSVGRRLLGGMVEAQVRSRLEALEGVMRTVKIQAERRVQERIDDGEKMRGPYWWDYIEALMEELAPSADIADGKEGEGEEQPLGSNLIATGRGVVHTIKTQPNSPQTSEAIFAIGTGAQLFPHKGGHTNAHPAPSPAQLASEAARETQKVAEGALYRTRNLVEGAETVRVNVAEDMDGAGERFGERQIIERQRSGWKSLVFKL